VLLATESANRFIGTRVLECNVGTMGRRGVLALLNVFLLSRRHTMYLADNVIREAALFDNWKHKLEKIFFC